MAEAWGMEERQDYVPVDGGSRVQHKARPQTAQHYGLSHILTNTGSPPARTRRALSAVSYRRDFDTGLGLGFSKQQSSTGAAHKCRCSVGVPLEAERLVEENQKLRVALSQMKEVQRLTKTENHRVRSELAKKDTNLRKAEELLNLREKALSPTIGLSQMYRTSDTTHLITNLREKVHKLNAEKERFRTQLEDTLKSIKATKVAELQSELHAVSYELDRQCQINSVMREAMERSQAEAQAATAQADAALALARNYANIGETMPPTPARLAPGNTISQARVRKTMAVLTQAHRALLSQAQLIRAVFPPGMSMEEFANRSSLKPHTFGGTQVLQYLRLHVSQINAELSSQPGGPMDPEVAAKAEAAAAAGGGASRGVRTSSSSGAGAAAAAVAGRQRLSGSGGAGRPPAGPGRSGPSSPPDLGGDNGALLQAIADLVRALRSMDMDGFMGAPDFEAEVEQLSDVMELFVAEHRRLKGVAEVPVFDDDDEDVQSQQNPLYTPVPPADPSLVPAEQHGDDDGSGGDDDDDGEQGYEDEFDEEVEESAPREPEAPSSSQPAGRAASITSAAASATPVAAKPPAHSTPPSVRSSAVQQYDDDEVEYAASRASATSTTYRSPSAPAPAAAHSPHASEPDRHSSYAESFPDYASSHTPRPTSRPISPPPPPPPPVAASVAAGVFPEAFVQPTPPQASGTAVDSAFNDHPDEEDFNFGNLGGFGASDDYDDVHEAAGLFAAASEPEPEPEPEPVHRPEPEAEEEAEVMQATRQHNDTQLEPSIAEPSISAAEEEEVSGPGDGPGANGMGADEVVEAEAEAEATHSLSAADEPSAPAVSHESMASWAQEAGGDDGDDAAQQPAAQPSIDAPAGDDVSFGGEEEEVAAAEAEAEAEDNGDTHAAEAAEPEDAEEEEPPAESPSAVEPPGGDSAYGDGDAAGVDDAFDGTALVDADDDDFDGVPTELDLGGDNEDEEF